jgi:hypothetical protein
MSADEPAERPEAAPEPRPLPWPVVLPVAGPALAAGLPEADLRCMARFWPAVHVLGRLPVRSEERDSPGTLVEVDRADLRPGAYSAAAICASHEVQLSPEDVACLLAPGGGAAWAGRGSVPSARALTRAGFCSVRAYGLLPPARPKVAVPLADAPSTQAGLSLYAPGRWHNRLGMRAAWLAAGMGAGRLLGRHRLLAGRRPGASDRSAWLLEALADLTACEVADAAPYLARDKFTLLLLGPASEPSGVAKVTATPLGAERLGHEAEVLAHLRDVTALRDRLPQVRWRGRWRDHEVCVQSAAARRPWRLETRLTDEHVGFLAALARTDCRRMVLSEWPRWARLVAWADGLAPGDAPAVQEAIRQSAHVLAGAVLPFHRAHGDFAPWNVIVCAGGIVVVDWEASEAPGMPFYDAVHFALRVARLIHHKRLPLRRLLEAPARLLSIEAHLAQLASAQAGAGGIPLPQEQVSALVRLCCVIEYMGRGAVV